LWHTVDAILKRITAPRFPESGPFPSASITGVRLADCAFENVEQDDVLKAVRGLALTNVRVNGELRRGSP